MFEFRALLGVDAGYIEHANTHTVRSKQRCARTAIDRGAVKKMLAPVQPDTLQFGQGGSNGGGTDAVLGQICAHAGDQMSARVSVVNGTPGMHHHAVRVGQNGEVAGVDNGAAEVFEHRFGCFNQDFGCQALVSLRYTELVYKIKS